MQPPLLTSKLFLILVLLTYATNYLIIFLKMLFYHFDRKPPHIPEIHLPQDPFLQVASALRIEINRALALLREIASGRELKKFLGVSFPSSTSLTLNEFYWNASCYWCMSNTVTLSLHLSTSPEDVDCFFCPSSFDFTSDVLWWSWF